MISDNTKKRVQTSLVLFYVLSLLEFFQLSKKILQNILQRIFFNTIFTTYLSIFCYLFLYFSNLLHLKFILYTLLISCISSDIGGFVFGKYFGGPRLTKISPKKTYAGAIGSIVLACLTISILFYFFTNTISFFVIIIGIVTSLGCQLGDLFFSLLKRKAKIKDTGSIFPGHGGILDRVDGILLGIPVGFFSLILIN